MLTAWPSTQAGPSAKAGPSAAAQMVARKDSPPAGVTVTGGIVVNPGRHFHVPVRCGQGETALGYAGIVRPGDVAAARAGLRSALLTQVSDSAAGQVLDFSRAKGSTLHFSRWLPVYPQSRQPKLLSCNYLLADKPAAKPILDAAIAAIVRAGYFGSTISVRSQLQEVLVSDDPATRGPRHRDAHVHRPGAPGDSAEGRQGRTASAAARHRLLHGARAAGGRQGDRCRTGRILTAVDSRP